MGLRERGKAKNLSLMALHDITQVLKVSVTDLVDVSDEIENEIEEKLAACLQGIKKQDFGKQIFILNVLEEMVEGLKDI